MRCLIGLDLRHEGEGALVFARWLREKARERDALELLPVHVVEEATLMQALRREHIGDFEQRAHQAAAEVLAAAGLTDTVAATHLLEGVDADDALANEILALKADAMIIGRRAESRDERWFRLGRVARRLLRVLPGPTIVVPPDLDITQIGDGPVMVATDLQEESAEAARFAKRFADALGRKVLVAHVVAGAEAAYSFVPAATIEQLYSQLGMEREKSLEAWKRKHGLADAPAVVAAGDVVGRLLGIAREERVPLLVSGSRRLSATERVFNASVGSTLAGYSPVAVAVVPPPGV